MEEGSCGGTWMVVRKTKMDTVGEEEHRLL